MTSRQQIISDLRLIQESDQDLELLNVYKGVPIIYKARILSIEGDIVRLKTQEPAMICLEKDKETRVLGNDFFDPATAQVTSFDIQTGTLELSDLSYTGTKLGDRMIVRVEPKEPTQVLIESGGQKTVATMADISLNGIGVRVAQSEYNPALKPGTIIRLSIQLPTGVIELDGMILSAARTNDFHRLSIRYTQEESQKSTIFRYLIDRRNEIKEELKKEYEASLGSQGQDPK